MKKGILLGLAILSQLTLFAQSDAHNFSVNKNLNIFNRVYKTLEEYYVDSLDANKIIPDAIQYMLNGLDPYTEYLSSEESYQLQTLSTGKYAGIGAVIRYAKSKDRCMIYEPYAGMPAAVAGLRTGDVILSIAGKEIPPKGQTATDEYTSSVSNQLRGDAGSEFELIVQRPGEKAPLIFNIKRASIAMPAVPYAAILKDGVGYIKLTTFTRGCTDLVLKELRKLKESGADKLILDLRDNGGGLAIEAVDLVNLFVPKNKLILNMKGKYKSSNVNYFTRNQPEDLKMPLVVLVNEGSASSSEITCGALQDLDRAVVMGQRTYGKGLVQSPYELPYGGVLKITTSHYYIPSGRCIQALDYSRKATDGSVYRTPDSLQKVFYTENKRQVRDGGGISPDVECKEDSLPNLIYYLRASEQLQDFCSSYRISHPTIAPPREFSITEEDYKVFCDSLKSSNFTYDRNSYKALQELRKFAQREGYAEVTKEEFAALEKKLEHDIDFDLNKWKTQIMRDVSDELALHYYFRKGYYASNLRYDEVVKKAVDLISNIEKYQSILNPKNK